MVNYRIKFEKDESVKYVSHLDTMRVFARALRRTGLKNSYSQGFNPHPVISLPSPLAVGISSLFEVADIGFDMEIDAEEMQNALHGAMPKGYRVTKVKKAMEGNFPAICMADYEIEIEGALPKEDVASSLMALPQIMMEKTNKRGTKTIDIKPFILSLKQKEREKSKIILAVRLKAGSESLKPELLVQAMNKYVQNLTIFFSRAKRIAILDENGVDVI